MYIAFSYRNISLKDIPKMKNQIFEGASSELDKILLTKISNFVVLMYS